MEVKSSLHAITCFRPWPSLILRTDPDRKDCENRTLPPPVQLVGKRVALHAGKKYSIGSWPRPGGIPADADCPTGIVGTVLLAGVLDMRVPTAPRIYLPKRGRIDSGTAVADLTHDELELASRLLRLDQSPWWAGPVGLLFLAPRALATPVSCNGAMGWWRVSAEHAQAVAAQEAQAA